MLSSLMELFINFSSIPKYCRLIVFSGNADKVNNSLIEKDNRFLITCSIILIFHHDGLFFIMLFIYR